MKKLSILFCLLMLTACNTTTNLSCIVDPNYRGNFQAKKMVIIGYGMSLDEQKELQNTLKESLVNYDVAVLRGLDVFSPTRHYSDKDMYEIAKSKGVDTFLIVSVDAREISEQYIPPTYHPGKSTSHVSGYGNYATVDTYTEPGYISGGYSIKKPVMNVSIYLKNTKNKETIWIAEGFSGGNAHASFSDLIVSVAKRTVDELFKEGLIAPKKVA